MNVSVQKRNALDDLFGFGKPPCAVVQPRQESKRSTLISTFVAQNADQHSEPRRSTDLKAVIEAFVNMLSQQDVRLVCIDFDNTMIFSVKDPKILRTTDGILRSVSPVLLPLMRALHEKGIDIIVTTFNMNPTIPLAFAPLGVPVVARSGLHSKKTGKLYHIRKAMKLNAKRAKRAKVKPWQVLLIDDYLPNIQAAEDLAVRTLHNPTTLTANDLAAYTARGIAEHTAH